MFIHTMGDGGGTAAGRSGLNKIFLGGMIMGRLLHGEFKLKIQELRRPVKGISENPCNFTARYNAKVIFSSDESIHTGDIVSLRMVHYDHPSDYIGRTNVFDGDINDIQDNPKENIDVSRSNRDHETYINPFGPV